MKVGTMVRNLSPNSKAKLFSSPHPPRRGHNRHEVGLLIGVGIILGSSGSDLLIFSAGISGWSYAGNVLEVHGCSVPEKIQDFKILNPDQWVVISETR